MPISIRPTVNRYFFINHYFKGEYQFGIKKINLVTSNIRKHMDYQQYLLLKIIFQIFER